MTELKQQISSIFQEVKDSIKLHIDYARLTGAEKLTSLLSVCVIGLVCLILVSIVVFLVSLALVVLLSKSTGVFGACMIMAGIYAMILVLVIVLRKQIILNPLARFISTLFLK